METDPCRHGDFHPDRARKAPLGRDPARGAEAGPVAARADPPRVVDGPAGSPGVRGKAGPRSSARPAPRPARTGSRDPASPARR
jgi:hypothetical protein